MAQTIQLRRGLQSALAAATMAAGEMAFTTDTGLVYVFDGTAKQLIGRVEQGALAARPAFGVSGRMYYATNTGDTYLDTGSAWVPVGVNDLASMSGNLDDIADGTTYQRVAATEVDASGNVTQVNDGANAVTALQARTHLDSIANPHSTSIANVGSGTLAQLNTALSDATLDDASGTRDPNAHAIAHTNGTDDIQSATNAQKGLATATHITDIESNNAHRVSLAEHRLISDVGVGTTDLWSANKIQNAIDNAATGIAWKVAVESINFIGNASITTINGLSPVAGDCYVATAAGTPTAGTSDALTIGSVAEFDGTSWKELAPGVGGFVENTTRLALSTTTALLAPYTDGTDDGKIVSFDGTTLTGADTGDSVDSNAVLVQDDNHIGYNDNTGWVFEGVAPTGSWVQFTGTGQINAGVGLSKSGNTLNVLLGAGIAELPTDEVGIDVRAAGGLWTTENGTSSSTAGAAQIAIKPDTTTGATVSPLLVAAAGAGVGVDNATVDHAAGILGVKDAGIGATQIASAALSNGLAGGSGTAITVDPDATTGATVAPVSVVPTGVGVSVDNGSIIHNAGTLAVSVVDGGTL